MLVFCIGSQVLSRPFRGNYRRSWVLQLSRRVTMPGFETYVLQLATGPRGKGPRRHPSSPGRNAHSTTNIAHKANAYRFSPMHMFKRPSSQLPASDQHTISTSSWGDEPLDDHAAAKVEAEGGAAIVARTGRGVGDVALACRGETYQRRTCCR